MKNNNIGIDKRIKKRKNKIIFLIMFFLFVVSTILILKTDIFTIKSVEVNGNELLTEVSIIELSGITLGNNIFKEKIHNIDDRLLAQPYIKKVKIKRVFPDKIRIHIEERKRAASIPFMGNFIIIDNMGYVLESSPDNQELVLIRGLDIVNFNEGKTLNVNDDQQLDKVLQIINGLNSANLPIIELDITNTEDIRFKVSSYLTCKIGNGTQLNFKFRVLQNILTDLAEKDIIRGIVDISNDGYPSYRPVE